MTATDQLRAAIRDLEAKARELELDKRIETFADQADHFLRVAATRAGELAAENRDRIDASLVKAGSAVDNRTDGKYAEYVGKVRAGLMTGVDWVAEQREPSPAGPPTTSEDAGTGATATAARAPGADTAGTGATATAARTPGADTAATPRAERTPDVPSDGHWADATDTGPRVPPSDS